MNRLALLFPFAICIALTAQVPVVSNIQVFDISHSSVSVSWAVTPFDFNTSRIRAGFTDQFEQGPGGEIYDQSPYPRGVDNQAGGYQVNLYGLAPDKSYHICAQVSADGGQTWSDCTGSAVTVFTTLPTPAVHPAYPASPATFSTAYPDTSGYAQIAVAADCSNLQNALNMAARDQPGQGSVILIPPGTACTGQYILPADSTVRTIPTSAIQTSTDSFTISGPGFRDGEAVRIAGSTPGKFALLPGVTYHVKVVDTNTFQLAATPGGPAIDFHYGTVASLSLDTDTITVLYDNMGMPDGMNIQVTSTGTLPAPLEPDTTYFVLNPDHDQRTVQLSASPGGPPIQFTSAGSGTMYFDYQGGFGQSMLIMPWPPQPRSIVIRSAAPDSQLPPEDVRISPDWQPSMAAFKLTLPDVPNYRNALTTAPLAHDYRIGPGIEFTTDDTTSADLEKTVDPGSYWGWWVSDPSAYDITLDRVYVHGATFYTRLVRTFQEFDGANMAVVNSYFTNLNAWTGGMRIPPTGTVGWHAAMPDASHVTFAAGKIVVGPVQVNNPGTIQATIAPGNADGCGYAWLTIPDHQLVFDLPDGASAQSVDGWTGWTSENETSPTIPAITLYGSSRYSVMPVANICFSSGALTSVSDIIGYPHAGVPFDAVNHIISGLGPGPFEIENNYMNATGILWHWDDSNSFVDYAGNGDYFCGPYHPQNITFSRNYVTADLRTILGSQWADGNRYYHRNHIECKNCGIFKADGNVLEHDFDDVTAAGGSLTFMATRCGAGSDFEISNNTFRYSQAGIIFNGSIPSNSPVAPTSRRAWIHNNLVYGIDSTWQLPSQFTPAGAPLLAIWLQNGGEDVRIEHNTFDTGAAWTHFNFGFWEGLKITDNYIRLGSRMVSTEGYNTGFSDCPAITDKSSFDCVGRAGAGNPDYIWGGNAFNIWNSIINNMPDVNSGDPMFMDAADHNYTLQALSPLSALFHLSTDGTAIGADIGALQQAQGWTDPSTAAVSGDQGANGNASITAFVPDAGASCSVGYGTTPDPTTWSRTAPDTSKSRDRSFQLTALPSVGTLYYQVWCAGTAPSPTETLIRRERQQH
jgi:hypothetical protein